MENTEIGRIVAVYMDLGCLMFVPDGFSDQHAETVDFFEFEQLGMNPQKDWEGRPCKLKRRGTLLVGAMLGW
jgi:hypothetical protein